MARYVGKACSLPVHEGQGVAGGGGGGRALLSFSRRQGGGGGSHPDPLPPPSAQLTPVSGKPGFWERFSVAGQVFLRALGTCQKVSSDCSMSALCSIVLQVTIPQCSLAEYFGSGVQPPPRVKCKDVINALLCFRVQARRTGRKRQEAGNDVQKRVANFFLSVPMATRCECVTVVRGMALQDRKVRCLPHEFPLSTVTTSCFRSPRSRGSVVFLSVYFFSPQLAMSLMS